MKGLAASHSCSEPSQRQRQSWHRDATDAARASAGRDDAGAGAVAIGRGDRGVAVDGGGSFIRTIPSLSRAARGGAPRCRFALGAVLALQWPRESPPPQHNSDPSRRRRRPYLTIIDTSQLVRVPRRLKSLISPETHSFIDFPGSFSPKTYDAS